MLPFYPTPGLPTESTFRCPQCNRDALICSISAAGPDGVTTISRDGFHLERGEEPAQPGRVLARFCCGAQPRHFHYRAADGTVGLAMASTSHPDWRPWG